MKKLQFIYSVVKEVILYQATKIQTLNQELLFYRQQNKCDWKIQHLLQRVENIVGKGKNTGYQHFLLFPECIRKVSLSWSLNVCIVR